MIKLHYPAVHVVAALLLVTNLRRTACWCLLTIPDQAKHVCIRHQRVLVSIGALAYLLTAGGTESPLCYHRTCTFYP